MEEIDKCMKELTNLQKPHQSIRHLFDSFSTSEIQKLNPSLVFTALLHCLGLKVEDAGKRKLGKERFEELSLRFDLMLFHISIESLSERMEETA